MTSPYKTKRETPFTKLGAVSSKSLRVGFKRMKGKLPSEVTNPRLSDEELEQLNLRLQAKGLG